MSFQAYEIAFWAVNDSFKGAYKKNMNNWLKTYRIVFTDLLLYYLAGRYNCQVI